ncbi:MAG: chemotaxis protein CheX [Candidatus Accumulibacter sp.]|jgi:chemotaxis protein CheX|nr:chemotaxis protein CheX [Accumulibacter sp.]
MNDINENDIRNFLDAISAFFLQATREKVKIESAYLVEAGVSAITFDLTSYIRLSGSFSGRIYFSAPRAMVSRLLLEMGEPDRGEKHLLDVVGEIANTISGNVRKHFGETMEISVPVTLTTDSDWLKKAVSPRSYVILIRWKQYRASVVVDIRRIG